MRMPNHHVAACAATQPESQEELDETDRRPADRHRTDGGEHLRRVQRQAEDSAVLADLGVAGRGDTGTLLGTNRAGSLGRGGDGDAVRRPRQAQGDHRAESEDKGAEDERPLRADLQEPDGERCRREARERGEHGELGVRAGEVVAGGGHLRDEGGPRDEVELAEDEHAEGLGEKQQSVDVARHQKAQHGRTDVRDRDARAASLPAAVEKWAERRPDEREGRDREQQVEQHLALGGAGRDREEERTRQRHRDAGRAGRLHGVDERQAAERLGLVEQAPDGGPDLPADPGDRLRLSHAGHGRGGSGCRAGPYPAKSAP